MPASPQLLLTIFSTDILPVFLVAGVGFLLARVVRIGVKPLSSVVFNALAPALVFTVLVRSTVGAFDFGRMAVFCVAMITLVGLAGRLALIPLRLDRSARAAFLLVVMFSNSGNFGLPLVLFAFGREALTFATVYFVTGAVLCYTFGVFLAASGRRTLPQALLGVARVPTVYAMAAAGLVVAFGLTLPAGLMRPLTLLADASVPMMLLVLGMQLERARVPEHPLAVAVATFLSLIVSPALALLVGPAIGLTGAALQAGVVQASMPAAVVTTILALEFDLDASLPTAVVFATTMLSPLTVTALVAYLRT